MKIVEKNGISRILLCLVPNIFKRTIFKNKIKNKNTKNADSVDKKTQTFPN